MVMASIISCVNTRQVCSMSLFPFVQFVVDVALRAGCGGAQYARVILPMRMDMSAPCSLLRVTSVIFPDGDIRRWCTIEGLCVQRLIWQDVKTQEVGKASLFFAAPLSFKIRMPALY